ncbi:hypothetical protein [Chondromyces crocatus]|uniref:Uncharacterized protein n=1 Tax=Chondromyces crocatus TaxID=52 RepID=A0A0K1EFQ7_CHOCO|nr:hypothetical protein [Chondromyces crocatus]AKT39527.1 uncharacterized protein CMC5_036740 [Chondromyces crocatus]
MSGGVAGAVQESNQQCDGNASVGGTVAACPVRLVLTIQRIKEWAKDAEAETANAQQGGTIAEFKLERIAAGKVTVPVTGFMLEAAGPSSKKRGGDERVAPGTFGMIKNPGAKGPYRLIQTSRSLAQAVFGTRGLVNIHIGNFPVDLEGCFCPGESWTDHKTHPSVSSSGPKLRALQAAIEADAVKESQTTYDGYDDYNTSYYSNVTVIVREIA